MDKLQFFVLIFAVLLSKLCNVSLCNYTVHLNSFSIDSGDLPYKIVENLKFELYPKLWKPTCITVPNLIKISQKVAEIG